MHRKISALIFSINEYELVKPKVELLYPYVDEIVIIDSSTDKNQKKLMENLSKKYKKVKVVWLPPIGIADFYYKIGINECKYDWILQLDADDLPNKKLLKDLRKLINDKYDAYKIYRKYRNKESKEFLFRLIKKDVAYPTGLIHWVMASSSKNYIELNPRKYFIEHKYRNIRQENLIEKATKYNTIELYQIGTKILFFFNRNAYLWFEYPKYFNAIKKFVNYLFKLGKFGFAILIILWNYSYVILLIKREKKFNVNWIKYSTLFLFKIFQNFHYKYLIYNFQYKMGIFKFLKIENKKEVLKLSKRLNLDNNSLENFKKLLNNGLKEAILREKMQKE
ncbi:MAG: glycosyltransferase [Candidatus Aenigmatarchaeota archaeon]